VVGLLGHRAKRPRLESAGIVFGVGLLAVAGLALLVVLAFVLLRAWRTGPTRAASSTLVAFGLGWVLISALPLLVQFYVSPTLEGSRYLYLPAVGWACLRSASLAGTRFGVSERLSLASALLLVTMYGARLADERQLWREATALRDAVLAEATRTSQAVPCRSLVIEGAPDNRRGVYVFRCGVPQALATLPLDPSGAACASRWNGSSLDRPAPR